MPLPLNINAQQLVPLFIPIIQGLLKGVAPGSKYAWLAGYALTLLASAAADASHLTPDGAPEGALAMPRHALPELPPRQHWTADGLLAFAEEHAGARQQPGPPS
jgi:hypothetical protein